MPGRVSATNASLPTRLLHQRSALRLPGTAAKHRGIGLLAAAILGGPVGLVAVASAGVGALTGALKDFGINDASISAITQNLQPNTSALLLLGQAKDREALLAKLREFDARVVMTTLDPEAERRLVARLQA